MLSAEQIKSIYKYLRFFIYLIPLMTVFFGAFFILFPTDSYSYTANNSAASKFAISENEVKNTLHFGIFPLRSFQNINLNLTLKNTANSGCPKNLTISLIKTYAAFLLPEGKPISTEDELNQILFDENKTKYPNGSLLHLKPTNEVFFVSHGKITLFPGPEIFEAFGFSFDNLTDIDKATADLFPVSDTKVFKWTDIHPDGTIFKAYPSHRLYIISNGAKHLIENGDLLNKVWPQNFTVPVDDPDTLESQTCNVSNQALRNGRVNCKFNNKFGSLGKYLNFTIAPAEGCGINSIGIKQAEVKIISSKTMETAKQSLQNIAASILNRYFFKSN
ncbi:MAG: hypothetical protein WC858_01015 [Parcubacteria group bacterium]|jgi:hypothetical protein